MMIRHIDLTKEALSNETGHCRPLRPSGRQVLLCGAPVSTMPNGLRAYVCTDALPDCGIRPEGTTAALDGGRVFLLLVNTVFAAVTKKKIPSKYEGYIHAAGMILLLGFMAFVTFKDIWKLVT